MQNFIAHGGYGWVSISIYGIIFLCCFVTLLAVNTLKLIECKKFGRLLTAILCAGLCAIFTIIGESILNFVIFQSGIIHFRSEDVPMKGYSLFIKTAVHALFNVALWVGAVKIFYRASGVKLFTVSLIFLVVIVMLRLYSTGITVVCESIAF